MSSTRLRRSLAAVATTIACLAIMATPAAATPHDVTITGGVITLTKTGITPVVMDLAPATPTCPSVTPTLELDVTGTAVSVTALHARDIWSLGATPILRVFTRTTFGATSGTLTGTTLTGMRVTVVMTFYTAYDPTTCTPTATPVCTLAFPLPLDGTLTGTTASSTFSLTGSNENVTHTVAFPSCTTGPSHLISTIATVFSTPLAGHLTT